MSLIYPGNIYCIIDLYNKISTMAAETRGVTFLPELKREHN